MSWQSPFRKGGDYEIIPDEKNFHFRRRVEVPKADVVVPSGQFAIDGAIDPKTRKLWEGLDAANKDSERLPKTKARIAAQGSNSSKRSHSVRTNRDGFGMGAVIGLGIGLVLTVGLAQGKR